MESHPQLQRVIGWLATGFTTAPPRGTRQRAAAPAPGSSRMGPANFETHFARLQQQRSFDAMWDLVAEDAQRSWGSRERFVQRLGRQAAEYELLEASVGDVAMVAEWTDARRNRTYRDVARVTVRYRIRHGWREVALDRQVHLVPAAGGWRTLYYPQEN